MRRLLIAFFSVLVLGASGIAAWHFLRPRDQLAEARLLMSKGDARAAQLVLRNAVQSNPNLAEAWLRLGQVQLQLGDPVAAEREFRTARDRGGDAHAITPLLAQAIVAQNRNDEVLRDYSPEGLMPDQAAAVLVARASAQMALKQPDAAAISIAEAQKLAPKSAETALAAARLAVARNDRAGAVAHVEETLALDPHRLEALLLQAELRNAAGDRTGAMASYAAALEQAKATGLPRAEEMVRVGRAALLLAAGDDAGARADVNAVLRAQPRSPLGNFLSARLLAHAQDWKAADSALSTVGPVLPRLPGGNTLLAMVKMYVHQPEQAIAALEQQVAQAPNDITAIKLLARIQLAQKRPDQATKVLAAASRLDAEGLDLMGGAYAAQGDSAHALAALRQASELAPDDARLLTRLAALQIAQGQAGAAVRTLDRAADLAEAAKPAPRPAPAPKPTPVALQSPSLTTDPTARPGMPPTNRPPETPTPAQASAALVAAALHAGEIDHAISALERLRHDHGDPGQIAMLSGTVKLAQIDLAGARAAFEEADRIEPKVPGARLNLARVLALQGQTNEATAMLQGMLAADPTDTAALTPLVNLLLQVGQPDKAIAAAETAQRAAPANPGVAAGLAALYLRTRHPDQALSLLDASSKVAGTASNPPPAFLLLRSQAQMALGQRSDAEHTLRVLLDQQPDNVVVRRQFAEMLAADKDYEGARNALREGLARSPGNATLVAASVAVAGSEGGPTAALTRATELARTSDGAAIPTLIGDVLMGQRKYAEAASNYQARLAVLPKDDPAIPNLQLRVAQAIAAGGDPNRAASLLRDWLATHPDNIAVTLALSEFDITAKRLPQGRAELEAVLAREPSNPAALNNLAWVSQQQGDLEKALTLAARANLVGPSPQSADTLGWILLAQGRTADAVALLREAALGQPQDGAIAYHLASALARAGQKTEAVTLLKAVAANPAQGFDEKPQAAKLLTELSAP
jgi:tetratricopeptide (TPR) repeat protein